MKILYYDCFSGISGDMNLGAMLDLGIPKEKLLQALSALRLDDEYNIKITGDSRKGITGTRVDVELVNTGTKTKARTYKDIKKIIEEATLSARVKKISLDIFDQIARAEAKIHGRKIDEVHFHEVGAVDSIIDIVGAAVCLDLLSVDKVKASAVELGGGFIKCQHGILPVPAPATAEILKGIPVKSGRVQSEATTPTGAAILASNAEEFTDKINFNIEKIGYGIGRKDWEIPNVLRVYLGEECKEKKKHNNLHGSIHEDIATNNHVNNHVNNDVNNDGNQSANSFAWEQIQYIVETNIDDMNPEIYEYVEELLFSAGALDVYKTPIIMKKGRPGVKLSILSLARDTAIIEEIILSETTAIGLRKYPVEKVMLPRENISVDTPYGSVNVKLTYRGDKLKYKPEYRDCNEQAAASGLPLREIYSLVDEKIKIYLKNKHNFS